MPRMDRCAFRSATSSRCCRWCRSRSASTSSTGDGRLSLSRPSRPACSCSRRSCRCRGTRRRSGRRTRRSSSPFSGSSRWSAPRTAHSPWRYSPPRPAAGAAAGAILVSRRGGGRYAFGAALAAVALTSVGATVSDSTNAHEVRGAYLPLDVSWVDTAGGRDVTLFQTAGSPPASAIEQLYWNRSITHEARVGAALATDVYAAPRLRIARDGTLPGIGRQVLFQDYAATARFANAVLVARAGTFSLWSANEAPRLSLLEEGRFSDGWLARSGKLTAWPDVAGNTRGTLRFTLSLPSEARPTTLRFGNAHYDLRPGEMTTVVYTSDTRGPWSLPFSTPVGGNAQPDLRFTSVRSSAPVFERAGAPVLRLTSSA